MPSHPAARAPGEQPIRILVADRNRMYSQLLAESLGRGPRFEALAVAGPADIFSMTARETDVRDHCEFSKRH
jgi:hypothetical protein